MVETEVREKTNETDGRDRCDIRQGEERKREEREDRLLEKKITEAKGEARGTTFTGFMSYNRLDRGIPRGLSVSGTIVLYVDLC